jgi:hypothetical protein
MSVSKELGWIKTMELFHHGVKGMKWGVRRDRPSRVTVGQAGFGGKKLKARGGTGHGPVKEATRAAKLGQIKKASGAHALSNSDLQTYAKRLELEAKVNNLEFGRKTRGQKFVASLTGKGQQHLTDAATNTASKQVKRTLKAKMARAGAKTVVTGLAVA